MVVARFPRSSTVRNQSWTSGIGPPRASRDGRRLGGGSPQPGPPEEPTGVRHRRIGATDLVASEVGLAVGPLVAGPGARPDAEVADLLSAALDLGIGYLAATDSDDDGRAERLLGAAVRGHRDDVTLATTFGYDTTPRPWEPAGQGPRHDWSPGFAGRALDRSLQRLGTEPVDLWLLHHPGMDAVESDELFEFLDAQVAKGKVRAYGVVLGPGPGWADEGAAALGERRVAAVEA